MKAIAILLLSLVTLSVSQAQDLNVNQKIKYVTHAPDGSIAFIITDNVDEQAMNLDASENFYKYEVIDLKSAKPLMISKNRGKSCLIDKTKLSAGNYRLKLYSKNFIITSKITILGFRNLNKIWKNEHTVALNKTD